MHRLAPRPPYGLQILSMVELILALAAVFIAGLTAGGLLFTFGNNPSTPTAFDEGKIALAFFLNGTANTKRQ